MRTQKALLFIVRLTNFILSSNVILYAYVTKPFSPNMHTRVPKKKGANEFGHGITSFKAATSTRNYGKFM